MNITRSRSIKRCSDVTDCDTSIMVYLDTFYCLDCGSVVERNVTPVSLDTNVDIDEIIREIGAEEAKKIGIIVGEYTPCKCITLGE